MPLFLGRNPLRPRFPDRLPGPAQRHERRYADEDFPARMTWLGLGFKIVFADGLGLGHCLPVLFGVGTVVSVLTSWLMIPAYGLIGAAYAAVITQAVQAAVGAFILLRGIAKHRYTSADDKVSVPVG